MFHMSRFTLPFPLGTLPTSRWQERGVSLGNGRRGLTDRPKLLLLLTLGLWGGGEVAAQSRILAVDGRATPVTQTQNRERMDDDRTHHPLSPHFPQFSPPTQKTPTIADGLARNTKGDPTPGTIGEVLATNDALTNSFQDYWQFKDLTLNTIPPREQLRRITAETGIHPALIFAYFDTSGKKATTPSPDQPQWSFRGTGRDQVNQSSRGDAAEDPLVLLLVTGGDRIIRQPVPGATRGQVMAAVQDFRNTITNVRRSKDYLPAAQQLYRWLIRPLESSLKTQKINNLTFLMDQGLRSLPLAALHDGQNFIIEKYSVGMMPSWAMTDVTYRDLRQDRVLAMGAASFPDQQPLPAVPLELNLIAKQLWSGDVLLNQDFTVANLQKARQRQAYGIVHLATHGEFRGGGPQDSYIEFGNGRLTLDRLADLGLANPPVDLLVLSACRTALGDRNSELGFAGLAVATGVKTALGSLWYVSDQGTLALMSTFYSELERFPVKAEALRQAQLAMIRGEVKLEQGQLATRRGDLPLPQELPALPAADLTDPYYWSGFTLVGNPW